MIEVDKILCDIIATDMDLDRSRIVVYDQNWKSPKDNDIYIVVSESSSKIIGNNNKFDFETNEEVKTVALSTTYNIEVTSKNTDAKYRKTEILSAIASNYSEQKQEENSIRIFRKGQIMDLSFIDGRSALHRYQIPVIINSVKISRRPTPFYDKTPPIQIDI